MFIVPDGPFTFVSTDMQGLEIPMLIPDFTLLAQGEMWDKHGNFQLLDHMMPDLL